MVSERDHAPPFSNLPQLGDRVLVDKSRGFVRYVGAVEGQKDIWIGIEWDDSSRGKHNGTVKGVEYFKTKSPMGGSLVKFSNILRGEDLLTQIRERYSDAGDDENESEDMGGRIVERIGMKRIYARLRDISSLSVIVLDFMRVSRPPPISTSPFSKCFELNLHGNLLHRWRDVFDILKFFPVLREFVLRNNRMEEILSTESLPLEPVTAPIFHLVLNDCGISETTVRHVLDKFPLVTDLYISKNNLSSFDPGPSGQRLRLVDLEHNPICSMSNVRALSKLPSLKSLSLLGCQLSNIRFDEQNTGFAALETLSVKENKFSDWDSVCSLSRLPSLSTLYIDVNLFPSEHELDVREILIAKLPSIVMLNRADVSVVERRSAEMRFLNKYSAVPKDKRIVHETDLERLITIHGAPIVDVSKKGMKIVRVDVEYEGKVLTRPLPLSCTVSKLCEMVGRLFSINPGSIQLHLDQKGFVSEMDLPTRQLSFYSLDQGDTIRVTVT